MSDADEGLQAMASEVAALADLRATIKWLVGSAGGTAVVLVGGLQLTSLRSLSLGAGILSAAAAAIAIGLALCLLTAAAKILATPRFTSTDLSDREIQSNALNPNSPEIIRDPLIAWARAHTEHLLLGERTVTDLCSLKMSTQMAVRELRGGHATTWQGRFIAPEDGEAVSQINRALQETNAALIAFENAVHHHRCQTYFAKMMRYFPWGGGFFIVAIITFAIASSSG